MGKFINPFPDNAFLIAHAQRTARNFKTNASAIIFLMSVFIIEEYFVVCQ